MPKTKIEVVESDEDADRVIDAVVNVARTGQIGDGKLFVSNLSEAIRIRTGETSTEDI